MRLLKYKRNVRSAISEGKHLVQQIKAAVSVIKLQKYKAAVSVIKLQKYKFSRDTRQPMYFAFNIIICPTIGQFIKNIKTLLYH